MDTAQHVEVTQAPLTMSATIGALAAALSAAQAQGMIAGLDKQNPHLRNQYASLASVLKAAKPAFDQGLSLVQMPEVRNGQLHLKSILCHSSGEWMESSLHAPIPQQKGLKDVQSMGSTVSYLRRYAAASILGIATGDDTDGEDHPRERTKRPMTNPQQDNRRSPNNRERRHDKARPEGRQIPGPATQEMPQANQGKAPDLKPSRETIRRFWAVVGDLGWEQIQARDVMNVTSLEELSDTDVARWADWLSAEKDRAHAVTYKPGYEGLPNNTEIKDFAASVETHTAAELEEGWNALIPAWTEISIFQRYWFSKLRHQFYTSLLEHIDDDAYEAAYAMTPSRYLGKSKAIDRIHKQRMKAIASKLEEAA